jgi:hypothetical protein
MSNADKRIFEIASPVRQYLTGGIRAEELVRIVDTLVANNWLHGRDDRVVEAVERLHEALALYVRDQPTRSQEPRVYIGDEELRHRAEEFEKALDQMRDTR